MGKKKILIGGALLFLAIAYLVYTGFASSASYYYSVGELLSMATPPGQPIRVDGTVVPGSVRQQGLTIAFTLADTQTAEKLDVTFEGSLPDTFKEGAETNIQGTYNGHGLFIANDILTKCASKYLPIN